MAKKYGIWARDLNDWIRGPFHAGTNRRTVRVFTAKREAQKCIREVGATDCEVHELTECTAVSPHHGDRCDGGRVESPNAQFTRDCTVCKGHGYVKTAS